MFETNTKNWEKAILEKGIERGIGIGIALGSVTQKLLEYGMSNADIRKITGLSLNKIIQIRKKMKHQ